MARRFLVPLIRLTNRYGDETRCSDIDQRLFQQNRPKPDRRSDPAIQRLRKDVPKAIEANPEASVRAYAGKPKIIGRSRAG
jgi:hypothetical protein